MDTTLFTILLLLALATALALIRSRRRDRCLRSLQDFHVTLAEQGRDLTWGRMQVYATGLEIEYPQAVVARGGHLERSFIFYNDQFDAMTALYRCPQGLSEEEQERRSSSLRAPSIRECTGGRPGGSATGWGWCATRSSKPSA